MARRGLLMAHVGERLLTSKLQILNGASNRRTSLALSVLTGRVADDVPIVEHESIIGDIGLAATAPHRGARQYAARTVYLSETHLADIDRIIAAWQQVEPRRITRSAVLRRAIEHLRTAIEADPVKFPLEND